MHKREALWGATFAFVILPAGVAAQTLTDAERSGRIAILMRADEARRANHLDEALNLIHQAEEIGTTAGTRMLTAQVLSQMGRYAAAHAAASQCVREVDLDTQTTLDNRRAVRATCERYRDEALRRVVRFTVRVPSSAPAAMVVRVDDTVLRPPLYNIEQIVDSGAVTVRATLGRIPPWQQTVTLNAGANVTVDVEVPTFAPPPPPPPPTTPPTDPVMQPVIDQHVDAPAPQPAAASPGSTQRALAWVSGALGLAFVGGGAVSGAMFLSQRDAYTESRCLYEQSPQGSSCWTQYNDLEPLNTLQYVGYIGGGALVVTSVILFATAPSATRAPALSVNLMPGAVNVSYGAHF